MNIKRQNNGVTVGTKAHAKGDRPALTNTQKQGK